MFQDPLSIWLFGRLSRSITIQAWQTPADREKLASCVPCDIEVVSFPWLLRWTWWNHLPSCIRYEKHFNGSSLLALTLYPQLRFKKWSLALQICGLFFRNIFGGCFLLPGKTYIVNKNWSSIDSSVFKHGALARRNLTWLATMIHPY